MIQDDVDKLCQWTINCLVFFNAEKCKVLHIGRDNPKFEYELTDKDRNRKTLDHVECEKDLGACVQDNLKFDRHSQLDS